MFLRKLGGVLTVSECQGEPSLAVERATHRRRKLLSVVRLAQKWGIISQCGVEPLRAFMEANTSDKDLAQFIDLAGWKPPARAAPESGRDEAEMLPAPRTASQRLGPC